MADLNVTIEESLSVSGILLGQDDGRRADAGPSASPSRPHRLVDLEVRSQHGRPLADGHDAASSFAAIPAVIYLAAGPAVTGGAMTIGTLVAFTALQQAAVPAADGSARHRRRR